MHPATVAAAWPVGQVGQIELLQGGINNRSFRVSADSGDYILRIYPAGRRPETVAFEMAVLTALAGAELPFQVPRPMRSRSGDLAPTIPVDDGQALALLAPVIPGAFCEPATPAQAESAGAALGLLHRAMAAIPPAENRGGTYADLDLIDPLFPDPRLAADLPWVDAASRERLIHLIDGVLAERAHWYGRLPQQVIHGDYVPYNLLMLGDRVSAVLDFELASWDLRALDFSMGLRAWLQWKGALRWEMGEAFVRGYTAHQAVTGAEIEALPFLFRVRRAATLVWWAGRYGGGTAAESTIRWAVEAALEPDDAADLVERVAGWAERKGNGE